MAEAMNSSQTESRGVWTVGYKKYGNCVVRFCTDEDIDPTVLIDKYANENPWFLELVTGVDKSQFNLGFGIADLEDSEYQPSAEDMKLLYILSISSLLNTLEPVAVIEQLDTSTPHSPVEIPSESEDQLPFLK